MRWAELPGGPSVHAAALALASGFLVLRLTGADRRWPWRVADLVTAGDAGLPPAAARRGGERGERRAPRRPRRARPAGLGDAVHGDLLVVIDRLRLAASAGHSLHRTVALAASSGDGPVSLALASAVSRYERGAGRLIDELERLPRTAGPALGPLCTTLVLAASSGAPLGPSLERLASAERRRIRRRAEERVRRLPILLLAPMVGLILPAFVLLTIVPVGLTTARGALLPLPP